MAEITDYLEKIMKARYGEEVRGSIHDAIALCYADPEISRGFLELLGKNFGMDQISIYVENKYINNTNGALTNDTAETFKATDYFIPINSGQKTMIYYVGSRGSDYTNPYNAFYDKNERFISHFNLKYGINDMTPPANAEYIRFSFPKTDYCFIQNGSDFDEVLEKLKYLYESRNLGIIFGSLYNGTADANGDLVSNPNRLTNYDFISVKPYRYYQLNFNSEKYQVFKTEYDADEKKITQDSVYTHNSPYIFRTQTNTKNIRFTFAREDQGSMNRSDIFSISPILEEYPIPDSVTKVKVMQLNIGNFSYGAPPVGIPSGVYDQKLMNWKKFFGEVDCDIIGMEEYQPYLDVERTKSTETDLFSPLYPKTYHAPGASYLAMLARYKDTNYSHNQFSTGRYYIHSEVSIEGKFTDLYVVHLSPQTPSDGGDVKRRQEVKELVDILKTKSRFIVFGDMNNYDREIMKPFTDSGFKMANGGYFGWYKTWMKKNPDTGEYYLENFEIDNIIVSPNITIANVEVLYDEFDNLTTDHLPFIAELIIE